MDTEQVEKEKQTEADKHAADGAGQKTKTKRLPGKYTEKNRDPASLAGGAMME